MKKIMLLATVVAMSLAVAMPVNAQSRKDKRAAAKAQWEMEQKQQREEAELKHKLRMDSIANAGKVAEEQARKAEAERRAQEAEEKARQKKAAEAAALQEVDFEEPCTSEDWPSTEDLLRARGIGEDLDHQFSVDIARSAAIEELGSQISTKVNALITRERKNAKKGVSRASLQKAEAMTVTEVNQETGFRVACRKTKTFIENGERVYKTYMVIELPSEKLLKDIYNNLQQDEDLKLDMNFDGFKKEFDERFGNAQ